jgi:type I restriction enzyme R subunit
MKKTISVMKYTESKLEQTFAELLQNEEYAHSLGETLVRNTDEALIECDFHNFLFRKYRNDNITENEIKQIILQLRSLPASDLYESNKKFCRMLSDGFILKREDRRKKDIYIQLIDFTDLENQRHTEPESLPTIVAEQEVQYGTPKDQNIYRFVTQLEITGNEKRIPDGIIVCEWIASCCF